MIFIYFLEFSNDSFSDCSDAHDIDDQHEKARFEERYDGNQQINKASSQHSEGHEDRPQSFLHDEVS